MTLIMQLIIFVGVKKMPLLVSGCRVVGCAEDVPRVALFVGEAIVVTVEEISVCSV